MASITFFPLKKKKKNAHRTQAHNSSTVLHKVTASTLNLGRARWMSASIPECLHHRIVPLYRSGAWEQDEATNHQIISCRSHCIWPGFFLLFFPPIHSFLLASFDQFASVRFHKDEFGRVKNNTIYPNVEGNEGTRHLAQARYQKFA